MIVVVLVVLVALLEDDRGRAGGPAGALFSDGEESKRRQRMCLQMCLQTFESRKGFAAPEQVRTAHAEGGREGHREPTSNVGPR